MSATTLRTRRTGFSLLAALLALVAAPAVARASAADPARAIDGDLATPAQPSAQPAPAPSQSPAAGQPEQTASGENLAEDRPGLATPEDLAGETGQPASAATTAAADGSATWHKDDLIGAAEGVFGKGAAGLAEMIEDLLKKQGEPNAYIVGREGGGAILFGLRYGSGTLFHKIEGRKPVYWTGPSIGLDAGANAASTFVLVYNLFDTEELYKRFGAGEGQAYLVGGFHVSYLRRGDKVLIPVRSGAGLRLGVNAGYMRFTHKQNWLPF